MSTKPTPPRNRRVMKVNAMSFAKLCAAMIDGTMTKQDLADHTGLHYLTVCQYTRELHRQGAAHILMWEKDNLGRDAMPVFKLGAGRDAVRHRITAAQRQQRYRERMQAAKLLHRMVSVSHVDPQAT